MKKIYNLSTVFLTLLLLSAGVQTTAQTHALVQPTATGIQWQIGTTHNIVWTLDPAQCVDIWLSDRQDLSGTLGINHWRIINNLGGGTTSQAWTISPTRAPGDYYIVITNCDGTTFLAASINSFELSLTAPAGDGEIHVEQPNVTGIQWEPGKQYGIYWTDDLVEPVKLELWEDDGANAPDVIYAGTSGLPTSVEGTGYIWTIPAAGITEGNYFIRVASTTTDVEDFGDNSFAITTTFSGGTEVHMIQPDVAGLQWESGTRHLISWMDDLIENVNLVLYIRDPDAPFAYEEYKVGAPGYTDPSALPTDRAGTTVDWDIPATLPNGNYKIYAVSSIDGSIDDISENPFEITNTPSGGTTITLIQPEVAGIQWLNEGTYVISWMDDLIETVMVELWYWNAGAATPAWEEYTDYTNLPAIGVVGTTIDWTIPPAGANTATQLPTGDYRIKIKSSVSSINDISTNSFEITATPHGGETIEVIQPSIAGLEWELDTDHLISWMDDLIEPVDIDLCDAGGAFVEEIANNVSGTTYEWDIVSATYSTGTYKVKVYSSASTPSGISENTFKIIDYSPYGEVIMIQPNGGEKWLPGGTYLISWTDNISENVKIELSENGGTTYSQVLAASVPGSTWAWNTTTNPPTGSVLGANYKIRVSSINSNSSATDFSETTFSFVNTIGGEVWVIQPDGGEVWVDETEHLISWMDELVENVYVKLLKGGDDPVANLVPWILTGLPANAYSGPGIPGTTLTWDIPETGGTCYDFDALSDGDFVAQELGGNWDTWNSAPGTATDATVSNTHSVSGSNSFVVTGSTDLKLEFGGTNLVSGVYSFSNDIYIPAGKTGYWNLQNEVDYSGGWSAAHLGFQIEYNASGNYIIGADGTYNTVIAAYSNDTWYHNEMVIDLDNDWCYFYIDGVLIIDYQWSKGVTNPGAATLALACFYDNTGTDEAYFDNVCFSGGGSGLYAGTDYKIRIESIYDPTWYDISEGTFTITAEQTGGTTIVVNQPNGGEVWALNTEHLISWDDDVFEDVNIDLVDANEAFIRTIATNVEGTTYVWDIDDALYGVGTYKVRVYSPVTSSLEDYSDGIFTITGTKEGQSNFTLTSGIGELVIYPNPASTQFNIDAAGNIDKVVVRNMLGQVLYTSNVDASQTVVDVSAYEAGIYIVNVIVEGEVVTQKLFVQ